MSTRRLKNYKCRSHSDNSAEGLRQKLQMHQKLISKEAAGVLAMALSVLHLLLLVQNCSPAQGNPADPATPGQDEHAGLVRDAASMAESLVKARTNITGLGVPQACQKKDTSKKRTSVARRNRVLGETNNKLLFGTSQTELLEVPQDAVKMAETEGARDDTPEMPWPLGLKICLHTLLLK